MKHTFVILIPVILIATACRSTQVPAAPTQILSGGIAQATSVAVVEIGTPTAQADTSATPEYSVFPPAIIPATVDTSGAGAANGSIPANGITMADKGRTFTMRVDESFLLNLGMDVYDWSVEVDNQNVLSRKINITVIRGAQGVYQAHNPGTATLTATGNPLCLQSSPPCGMPSVLFEVTVIVQ